MIRAGASLVVGDENNLNEQNYYAEPNSDNSASSRRRQAASSSRTRTRRPATHSEDGSGQQPYWRGRVEDDNTPIGDGQARDEIRGTGRRRKQPAIREPLAALEKEQKLYELRDKQRHDNLPNVSTRDKSYRRPYSQAKKESDIPLVNGESATNSKTSVDLKNILKNAGGLSLSEILQQKNLSLDDLLKGKQNALQVLQSTAAAPQPAAPTKAIENKPLKPMRRIPYLSSAVSSTTQQTYTDTADTSAEVQPTPDAVEESEDTQVRSKVKMPTLQRLKYFSSSSRGTTSGLYIGSTTRRSSLAASSTTTTTTTTSTTTTTRLPIYKKNLMQRSTLKPPFLLKNVFPTAQASAEPETKAAPNFEEKLTTTIVNNRYNKEPSTAEDEEVEEVAEEQELDAAAKAEVSEPPPELDTEEQQEEEYLRDEEESVPSSTSKYDDEEQREETTAATTTSTFATTSAARATTKEATTNTTSKSVATSARDATATSARPVLQRAQPSFKTNSIELDDTRALLPAADNDNDSFENFFGAADTNDDDNKPREKSSSTADVENITPRIDHIKPAFAAGNTFAYQDSVPDFDGVDDRTDLLELIEDRRSGNRLFKVLEQRNMTLEELIEHRKRGSSQLHLATVVQNRSRFFPGQKVVLHDNMDIVTAFENFPHFNLMDLKSVKPDDIKTDSQGASYFTSIIDIEPTDEIYKDETRGGSKGSSSLLQTQRNEKSVGFFPSWKTLALASLASSTRSDASTKRNPFFVPPPQLLLENTSAELDDNDLLLANETNINMNAEPPLQQELSVAPQESNSASVSDAVDTNENDVERAHDLLDLELSGHGFKRSPAAAAASTSANANSIYSNMSPGIRSAIVASAAIVLTSLATFMVVFMVCRWKQRRQRKTSYTKTYNAMKSKLPTVTNASRRSSLRNMEEMVGGVSTVSVSPMHQLQHQTSLLFPARNNASGRDVEELSCGGRSDGGRRSNRVVSATRGSLGNSGGIGSATGSTTSLALSLQSVHNSSTNKLNTMDPNSPEVQEYLFDALRKSY